MEGNFTQPGTVNITAGGQDTSAELMNKLPAYFVFLEGFVAYLVRIQDNGSKLGQELRHSALAAADATGKTDNLHQYPRQLAHE
jgi:hypothetical protein